MKEKQLFCPYLNRHVTISSCTLSTDSYGKGSKSVATSTMCQSQENCSKRYACIYSSESNCSFDPLNSTSEE